MQIDMKSAKFNKMMAESLTIPEKKVVVFARLLKEAGLLTTGARGRNAPEMTPLDAARMTLAILTTDSPSECVERVKRFGEIKFSPEFSRNIRGYETITPHHFEELFQGETLEEVLAYIFGLPGSIGLEESFNWFNDNNFHLRVKDFEILAELFENKMQNGELVGELVVPFKGKAMIKSEDGWRHIEQYRPINGGVRTERMISGISFKSIGINLMVNDNGDPL